MPHPTTLVSLTFPPVATMIPDDHGLPEWSCPKCQGELDLVQPDPARPDRLIGVCRECPTWILAEVDDESDEIVRATLPERLSAG